MARRVLLATFGSHGDLNPYLAIGKELSARGIEAVIATSEVYRADVEHCGLEIAPVRPDFDTEDDDYFAGAEVQPTGNSTKQQPATAANTFYLRLHTANVLSMLPAGV